jgi:hypothetical protein
MSSFRTYRARPRGFIERLPMPSSPGAIWQLARRTHPPGLRRAASRLLQDRTATSRRTGGFIWQLILHAMLFSR